MSAGAALHCLARPGRSQGQSYRWLAEADLAAWAVARRLSLRTAYQQALEAGFWPESLRRNFPSLTVADQARLWAARVLVAGLGGLGGMQAPLLTRLGVGSLVLVDGDVFAPSNLNRQALASRRNLGRSKAREMADYLVSVQPGLELQVVDRFLRQAADWESCLSGVAVVLDALDNLPSRQALYQAARAAGVPLIHGAVLGPDGQVTTLLPADPPGFAQAYLGQRPARPEPPPVLAPAVAVVAGLQVQEAVRLLLGRPLAYHGRLAYWDGASGRLELLPLGAGG